MAKNMPAVKYPLIWFAGRPGPSDSWVATAVSTPPLESSPSTGGLALKDDPTSFYSTAAFLVEEARRNGCHPTLPPHTARG